MSGKQSEQQIVFASFRLDVEDACLWREDHTIPLTPKAFAVLRHLVARPNRLVSKEELLTAVWPDAVVGEAVLKTAIRELRKALADNPKTPQFIETAHRRGYRFIAPLATPPRLQGTG
ncbi:MAG: transcriptional regulator, partial [Deltaproteobacteria bacterium]|nr:transcriptional regulator [Deltaproteobacteria bacterium]